MQKPVASKATHAPGRNPSAGVVQGPKHFSFSMKYFRQIKYFGFSGCDSGWLASLTERLQELSTYLVDEFRANTKRQQDLRYHLIDWTARNIPIQRSDLNWLASDYLLNAEEYPLYQFMISQGTGRVVGFWDEDRIFQIVLLDPLHNLQPAKSHNYRVDNCFPVHSEFYHIKNAVDDFLNKNKGIGCGCDSALQNRLSCRDDQPNVIRVCIADEQMTEAIKVLRDQPGFDLADIFYAGLVYFAK